MRAAFFSRGRPARRAEGAPLRVLFVVTSMPVGGAEMLLARLARRMDRERFEPEICCLKQPGPLGRGLASEIPVHVRLLAHKYDVRVLARLVRLLRRRRIDAVVTVGAGDKMFWGRLAAWLAGVPVIVSALHSTGWPDEVGRLNRWLTPLTDAVVAVAREHGRFLAEQEGFPADRVRVIPNGVDPGAFRPATEEERASTRRGLGLPIEAPVCGIVAALRWEKDHRLFLQAARRVWSRFPNARFLVVGDGPEREALERMAADGGMSEAVEFMGQRSDVARLLRALDVFVLTSRNEANPVSILEAMSAGLPVVATRVGSTPEVVRDGVTGYLTAPGDAEQAAARCADLLRDPRRARRMGLAGRRDIEDRWTLEAMVSGYEELLEEIYERKCGIGRRRAGGAAEPGVEAEAVAS